jgi:hypothetical protein
MKRKQPGLEDTDEGHSERLRRAVERSRAVLTDTLAQDPTAPEIGMKFHVSMQQDRANGQTSVVGVRYELADPSSVAIAAIRARPFTLKSEEIQGTKVAGSIDRFAKSHGQHAMAEQLGRMWAEQPFTRMKTLAAVGGHEVTPRGGVSDGTIADRVLYSQFVHADDASEVLEHIDEDQQLWSLAGMVGDWLALVSHQEYLISAVRPDLCSELTAWAGDGQTIFKRLGVRED